MKKVTSTLFRIMLFIYTLLICFSCSKSTSDFKPLLSLMGSKYEVTDNNGLNKNYCRGCGTSNMDTHGCIGNDCVNVRSGCMIEFALNLDFNQTVTEAHQTQKRDGFHEIRDSFLLKSNLGQWYITYYYELGKVASDNNMINMSNAPNYLSFAMMTLDVAETIRNGSPTDIPIDNSYRDKALGFIHDFRNNTSDTTILGYLNDIELDLNNFLNKDVNFIRTTIGL